MNRGGAAGRALGAVLLAAGLAPAADVSSLWGSKGEAWKEDSRLPDFSFAGYRLGEAPLPTVPVVGDVRSHGARGDGQSDDTEAFKAAVKAPPRGAILVPPGRYVLTDVIEIRRSGIVLRGAGPDKTILVIPKSLQQIHPAENVDGFKSRYSFSGGFLAVTGSDRGRKLAEVAAPTRREERRLTLARPAGVRPGQFVRLVMNNHPGLGRHLHADQLEAGKATFQERKNFVDWAARVAAVEGGVIVLDRPLRLDVRPEWDPEILSCDPSVEEVGIEDLAFEFPGVPKKKHLEEEGFNAIHLRGAVNCWVRNVSCTDADNGVIVSGCRFCTVQRGRFREARRTGLTGHHALWATGGSQDCLFEEFRMETKYVHDLTVEGLANGNVFRRGTGVSVNFDHHRNAPYENLFTDIDVGDPSRVWTSSGRGDRGPHAGARETFWNIRAASGRFPKVPGDWPQIIVVGMAGTARDTTPDRQWVEPVNGPLQPPDLYEAQRRRRLGMQ